MDRATAARRRDVATCSPHFLTSGCCGNLGRSPSSCLGIRSSPRSVTHVPRIPRSTGRKIVRMLRANAPTENATACKGLPRPAPSRVERSLRPRVATHLAMASAGRYGSRSRGRCARLYEDVVDRLRTIRCTRPFPGGRPAVRGVGGFRRAGNRAARRSQCCNCRLVCPPSICRSLTLLRAGPQREKSAGPLREEPHGTPPASPRVGWRASCKARRSEVCVPAVQRRSPLDPARAARRPRPRPTAQTGEP